MNGALGCCCCCWTLVLFLTGDALAANGQTRAWEHSAPGVDDENNSYCRLCKAHTMCLFPSDKPGSDCIKVNDSHLNDEEIGLIVNLHNSARNDIARVSRSNSTGYYLKLPAREMMQLFWDVELAKIARRWALQCQVFEEDKCRDVERFAVLQNVLTHDLERMGNKTTGERLEFYVKSWHDTALRTPQVSFGVASPSVVSFGCGRVMYDVDLNEASQDSRGPLDTAESLVCNYGPIDTPQAGQQSQQITSLGCEKPSTQYPELCLEEIVRRKSENRTLAELRKLTEEAGNRTLTSGATIVSPLSCCYLVLLLFVSQIIVNNLFN